MHRTCRYPLEAGQAMLKVIKIPLGMLENIQRSMNKISLLALSSFTETITFTPVNIAKK